MNQYLSGAQLKDLAKERLQGRYGLVISATLVIGLINSAVSVLLPLFSGYDNIAAFFISGAISFLFSVFLTIFGIGLSLIYLKLACGRPASLRDIFYGFSHNPEKSLAIALVMTLIQSLPTWGCEIPYALLGYGRAEGQIFPVFPCLALALVIYVPLSLALSQCYYLLLDFPEKNAGEILSLSFRIMKGHKARLFYIEVTFLPLLLLGFLSLVGLLWVGPYMQMTMAGFYLDIMKPVQKS